MFKDSMRKIFVVAVAILVIALSGCDPDDLLKKTTYTVEFKLDGGVRTGGGELTQTIEHGESAVAPVVTRSGYSFDTWDKEFTNITSDITVKALWSTTQTFTGSDLSFNMKLVPVPSGGITFPTGISDNGTASVDYVYQVGETLVTWKLWKSVYDWATSSDRGTDMYHFQNPGRMGSHDSGEELQYMTELHPVTRVSWRDSMVWCNAVTEWYNVMTGSNLEPVYRYNGNIVRDSRGANFTACDNVVATNNNGFRLPTFEEWELVARWRTNSTNTVSGYSNPWFTKGDSSSGATANNEDSSANGEVAWFMDNSSDSTQPVATKQANCLGIYDMSGNVFELSFTKSGSSRQLCGGSWNSNGILLQIGYVYTIIPVFVDNYFGFRLFRTP
ncbi:MAG: SUMF1/EgtB/PvdO family nonheme iron enzyme [Spirochaetales bacterium]|nr:SUMF1/EgtB/PvdO family nonheme iron enzyme [Spirochaetales bacterium]